MPIHPHKTIRWFVVRMLVRLIVIQWMLPSIGLFLCIADGVCAQGVETTNLENPPSAPYAELPIQMDVQPNIPSAEAIGDPEWSPSPYQSSLWKVDIGYIPTTVSWDDDFNTALRLSVAREDSMGFGRDAQLWVFNEGILSAQTFYYDFYKRLRIEKGQLDLGGGFAAGHLRYDWHSWDDDQFFGGGGSIFGRGYYPLLSSEKTSLGAIGRARLALLAGVWDDGGKFTVDRNSLALIDEFAWGLEFRRRFGRGQNKYWYIDVERELQDWGALLHFPYPAGLDFQGTAINFGLAW